MAAPAGAIQITLDYTFDEQNENWFGGSPEGDARRASLDAAAGFLSEIITNDDWQSVSIPGASFLLSDVAASSLVGVDGETIVGTPESDGVGYYYYPPTSNRSSVGENEYVVYVTAYAFDAGTSSHAKAGWHGEDRRNAAGVAGAEFNTWGGKLAFDTGDTWYTGQNPGVDPTDDYGLQDPDKTPSSDTSSDNWDYSTSSHTWKGFDLESVDPSADGRLDLYATALHELLHALGATSSNFDQYIGVDNNGDLIGENVVATFGGPVPATGGHVASNTQSIVWGSESIVSEAVLDPTALRSVRKYLTEIDAALLRDLGYTVSDGLVSPRSFGDFNADLLVDAADYTVWRDALGLASPGPEADADGDGQITLADYRVWADHYGQDLSQPGMPTPEPTATALAAMAVLTVAGAGRRGGSAR